ncbi:MAG: hypothetical protein LBN11_05140, partial [Tannerella sp.]|nr:hypothetical protein [Tannerella sp.]
MNKVKSIIIPLLLVIFNINIDAQTDTITSVSPTPTDTFSLPPEVMAWTKSSLDAFSYKHYKSLKEAIIDNNIYIPTIFEGGKFPELNKNFSIPETNIIPAYSWKYKQKKDIFSSYAIKKMLEDGFYKEMLKNPLNFKYT